TTNIRLLLVDDEPGFTRMLERNLKKRGGFEVEVVNDSTLAARSARKFLPDLILLDIQMPGIDGGDLARHLRGFRELATTPILFVSAMVSPNESQQGLFVSGGEQFMAKPVDVDILLEAINQMVTQKSSREDNE
ncbi:MAG: response regulator, partial [Puniceicoccales bacterium]